MSLTNEVELLNAKRTLYHLLLKKDIDGLTDNELDLMYNLANDDQIQKFLETKLKGEKVNG